MFDKAASLIQAIIKNHPFIDGNKRTAMIAGIVFLKMNYYETSVSQKKLVELALEIADSKLSLEDIAVFLEAHSAKS